MPNFSIDINHNNHKNNGAKKGSTEKPLIKLYYSLKDADRALSQVEEENENEATKLSLKKYPRISPIPVTLGYLFRNIKGGNDTVVNALKTALAEGGTGYVKLRKLIQVYEALDKRSKSRVDVFDHLITFHGLEMTKQKLWSYFQEGLFVDTDMMVTMALTANKQEMVEKIIIEGLNGSFKDRELYSKITNLVDEKAAVEINDNRKVINNNVNVFGQSFTDTIRGVQNQLKPSDEIDDSRLLGDDSESKIIDDSNIIEAEYEDINLNEQKEQ
jgi:hypothetical protein